MKSTHRQTAAAVGLFALSLVGAPAFAQRPVQAEQRGGPPKPDTYWILVTTFHSPDRQLGILAADEVRKRLQSEYSMKDLAVVTKGTIKSTLEASGYPPDSALNAADLMELSRQVHGEYVIDGKASKNGSAVRLESRVLLRTGQQTVAQPLPPAEGKDAGEAAKSLEKSLAEALKGMPMYRKCITDLRAAKNEDAIVSAKAGITAYPSSVLSRICLLTAYINKKDSPDSIISVANQILASDTTSMLALTNLVDAYNAKGDTNKAIATNLRIYRLDPRNQERVIGIINDLLRAGAANQAIPLIDTLLVANPGDTAMLQKKWVVQLNARQFKNAIATGEALVRADSTIGTVAFYNRQIGAAQNDSNPAKIIELASKAAQKFPKDASFPMLMAQSYRKLGQLPQAIQSARRAAEIEPKETRAWLLAIFTANEMNQPDSALALAKAAVTAGADKEQLGAALLGVVAPAVKKAQDSKERADWEAALKSAESLDGALPSPTTKFYVGLAAFQVGLDALQNAQKLGGEKGKDAKESKVKACAEAKVTEDMWATASINMPPGAQYNKEGAGQVMGVMQQYGEYIPQMKKLYCPK